eukprot:1008808-Pleurochrysis_carterae.AAC.1
MQGCCTSFPLSSHTVAGLRALAHTRLDSLPFVVCARAGAPPSLGTVDAPPHARRRASELRGLKGDVSLQSVRIAGTQRHFEEGGHEYVAYLVESVLVVHGVQTTLRSVRRYKHFDMLDTLLRQQFGASTPPAMPAKRAFGNLQPGFVEERR